MPKLYKIIFMDGTWTAIIAENDSNARRAVEILFPAKMHLGMPKVMDHYPLHDARPPVAENVLTLIRK